MSSELASFLFFICIFVDAMVLTEWLRINFTESNRRWPVTVRGILILMAVAACQLWLLHKQLN
jgi:hypothetical protein